MNTNSDLYRSAITKDAHGCGKSTLFNSFIRILAGLTLARLLSFPLRLSTLLALIRTDGIVMSHSQSKVFILDGSLLGFPTRNKNSLVLHVNAESFLKELQKLKADYVGEHPPIFILWSGRNVTHVNSFTHNPLLRILSLSNKQWQSTGLNLVSIFDLILSQSDSKLLDDGNKLIYVKNVKDMQLRYPNVAWPELDSFITIYDDDSSKIATNRDTKINLFTVRSVVDHQDRLDTVLEDIRKKIAGESSSNKRRIQADNPNEPKADRLRLNTEQQRYRAEEDYLEEQIRSERERS